MSILTCLLSSVRSCLLYDAPLEVLGSQTPEAMSYGEGGGGEKGVV